MIHQWKVIFLSTSTVKYIRFSSPSPISRMVDGWWQLNDETQTLLQGSELNVIECFLETKVPIIGNINSEYFVPSDVTPHFYGECRGKYEERLNFVTSLLFNLFPEKFSVK